MTIYAPERKSVNRQLPGREQFAIPIGNPTEGAIRIRISESSSNQTMEATTFPPNTPSPDHTFPQIAFLINDETIEGGQNLTLVGRPDRFAPSIIVELINNNGVTLVKESKVIPETWEYEHVHDDDLVNLANFGNEWKVVVRSDTPDRLNIRIVIDYIGSRPLLEREVDLDILNRWLDRTLNEPQPIRIGLENRHVDTQYDPRVRRNLKYYETFLTLEASPELALVHPFLVNYERALGDRVSELNRTITGTLKSNRVTVEALIFRERLSFRIRTRFEFGSGNDLVLDLKEIADVYFVDGFFAEVGLAIADAFIDEKVHIKSMDISLFAALGPADGTIHMNPFTIMNNVLRTFGWANVQTTPRVAGSFIGGLIQQALDINQLLSVLFRDEGSVGYQKINDLLSEIDQYVQLIYSIVLGDPGLAVVGGNQKLAVSYYGLPSNPAVPTLTIDGGQTSMPQMTPGNLGKIDHIVVIMMENRSFDQMLGYLSLPKNGNNGRNGRGRRDVDGLKGNETNPSVTKGLKQVRVFPFDDTRQIYDAGTSFNAFKTQNGKLAQPIMYVEQVGGFSITKALDIEANQGYVIDFANRLKSKYKKNSTEIAQLEVDAMGYHPRENVPVYDFLADNYCVCDRWFSSHPGHTWPNRYISLSGYLGKNSDGSAQIDNPDFKTISFDPQEMLTIFDYLTEAEVEWRYYEHDIAMIRAYSAYTFDSTHVLPFDDPNEGFFARAENGTLPSVTYIEPDLTDAPPSNDDHPPSDIADGQQLIKSIYEALVNSPNWGKTMLIITYDEAGGFFDHVKPPENAAPLGNDPDTGMPINYYGNRVPSIIVSPWVEKASSSSIVYDHTSILKTIIRRFLSSNPPYMGPRVAEANDLEALLNVDPLSPRNDTFTDLSLMNELKRSSMAVAPNIASETFESDFHEFMGFLLAKKEKDN